MPLVVTSSTWVVTECTGWFRPYPPNSTAVTLQTGFSSAWLYYYVSTGDCLFAIEEIAKRLATC